MVSCTCCGDDGNEITCKCGDLSLEFLLEQYGRKKRGRTIPISQLLGGATSPSVGRYCAYTACLAFLCRCVDNQKDGDKLICSNEFGIGAVDLTSAAKEKFGISEDDNELINGETRGCYIYRVEFCALKARPTLAPRWKNVSPATDPDNLSSGSDVIYNIPLYDVSVYNY